MTIRDNVLNFFCFGFQKPDWKFAITCSFATENPSNCIHMLSRQLKYHSKKAAELEAGHSPKSWTGFVPNFTNPANLAMGNP